MDNKIKKDSNKKATKIDLQNEKKKKMDADETILKEVNPETKDTDEDDRASCSSTDSEDLVNAMNYNTITSLAALKDIIQGDGSDTPETDSFFQHYFMNHFNNLSSRNSNVNTPFPFPERRRLSQCREEDEDDDHLHTDHEGSKYKGSSKSLPANETTPVNGNETIDASKTEDKVNNNDEQDATKRMIMGPKHKFVVTATEPKPTPAPVEKALRSQVHNAHTVHFGTKGAEELRPSVRSIFAQNLHRDKNYFDSSLIEIRSTDVDGVPASSEDIWVRRNDDKRTSVASNAVNRSEPAAAAAPAVESNKNESLVKKSESTERSRSGTWGSQSQHVRKEKETVKKTPAFKENKAIFKNTDERRQKREQRLDAAITRSSQSVGERKRRGSADEGQPHPMYQQTIHGTTGVSRRPALFDLFKSKNRGDAKKTPSIMQQVKTAVQNITKSSSSKDAPRPETSKPEAKAEAKPEAGTSSGSKTRDGSAHPHPGSNAKYYHTVTASASRRPSAMAKVMDIFRGRASIPGQTVPMEGPEKRKAFWTDKKYSLKKIIGQRNADANRTGGGGPSNLPSLSSIEERMVAILGGRGFAEGDSQFTVPILPMPSQEPSTSTAPIPQLVEEEYILHSQEDVIILPLPGSPDHIPPVASTQSTPRRSPRIRARSSRQSARPTLTRERRSQFQVERDRLISIEERRVEAELLQARALQENMAGLTAACNNIAEAIRTFGTNLVGAFENLAQSR